MTREQWSTIVKAVVWVAALVITSRWEHGTGVALHMGRFAWAVPVVVDGYTLLAVLTHRDVYPALGVLALSVAIGAIREQVYLHPVALAFGTVATVVFVLARVETLTRPQVEPVHEPEPDELDQLGWLTPEPVASIPLLPLGGNQGSQASPTPEPTPEPVPRGTVREPWGSPLDLIRSAPGATVREHMELTGLSASTVKRLRAQIR